MGKTQAAKTHCPSGHSYADHGFVNSQGRRVCRLCSRARQREWHARSYVPKVRPSAEDRFWSHVNKKGPVSKWRPDLGRCSVWTAAIVDGYGQFALTHTKQVRAHRFAYELLVGPIPPGLEPDHLCRNRACVDVTHMELVTPAENRSRGDRRRPNNRVVAPAMGKHNLAKTHCPQGHPYKGSNLYVDNRGKRYCRICKAEADLRAKAKKKAKRT